MKRFLRDLGIFLCVLKVSPLFLWGSVERRPLFPSVVKHAQVEEEKMSAICGNNPAVPAREDAGVSHLNGLNAFNKCVVQGSSARPVIVFFHAKRDMSSQLIRSYFPALVSEFGNKVSFAAVDIFEDCVDGSGVKDNENYRVAIQCMTALKKGSFTIPAAVFFKQGLMSSGERGILMGEFSLDAVRQLVTVALSSQPSRS